MLAEAVGESSIGTVGILFETNVDKETMKVVSQVDQSWHQPIRYYAAVVNGSKKPSQAELYMQFLEGNEAREILGIHGFDVQLNR